MFLFKLLVLVSVHLLVSVQLVSELSCLIFKVAFLVRLFAGDVTMYLFIYAVLTLSPDKRFNRISLEIIKLFVNACQ